MLYLAQRRGHKSLFCHDGVCNVKWWPICLMLVDKGVVETIFGHADLYVFSCWLTKLFSKPGECARKYAAFGSFSPNSLALCVKWTMGQLGKFQQKAFNAHRRGKWKDVIEENIVGVPRDLRGDKVPSFFSWQLFYMHQWCRVVFLLEWNSARKRYGHHNLSESKC